MQWSKLGRFRQVLLILLAVMAAGFLLAYILISAKPGIKYRDQFLAQSEENGSTLYSGKVQLKETVFTVTRSGEVTLRVGENTFGPYTVVEDDTVELKTLQDRGIIIYEQGRQIFRGVYWNFDGFAFFEEEPGKAWSRYSSIYFKGDSDYGTWGWDPPFELIVPMALGEAPVTHRGDWGGYWAGLFFSVIAAAMMLFAEKAFRHRLSLMVREPEKAEPSDWEIISRYIGWVLMTALSLGIYIAGLTK